LLTRCSAAHLHEQQINATLSSARQGSSGDEAYQALPLLQTAQLGQVLLWQLDARQSHNPDSFVTPPAQYAWKPKQLRNNAFF
jgi:hypothetical protein